MENQELAAVFERIAALLEIKGEVVYKYLAYRRAAESLRSLSEDIQIVAQEGRLKEIPGVGKAIADKIEELLQTGELQFLRKLEEEVPPSLLDILEIPDVGPKKAALFWHEAGITIIEELAAAAKAGKLRDLPGIGEKSEQKLIEGIEALSRRTKRMLLGTVRPIALHWLDWVKAQEGVDKAEIAGSVRRWKETIGDLDLVAASDVPERIMQAFVNHPEVVRVVGHGKSKSSVELKTGLRIQLWIQPTSSFGSLWQYASGSQAHNVRLREYAQKQGLSLSEHGLQARDGTLLNCSTEELVYQQIGLPWIPPELREDRGEIQAAVSRNLPDLIQLSDLRADLHTHSDWSDGHASIEEMANAAIQKGLKILAVTDHSHGMAIANGLSVEKLRAQKKEINDVQQKLGEKIRLLRGIELEIRSDGELDYPDEVLADLDIVVASLHTSLRQPREVITQRLVKAIQNPNVDIIAHPSGRLLPNREGADLDWEVVLKAAQEAGVALEIDSHPSRLDLNEIYARRAAEMGIPISIDSDAHASDQFDVLIYGVGIARRAWIEADQAINTWSYDRLMDWLSNRK